MTIERPIDWSRHRVWTAEKIQAERRELELADWGSPIEIERRRRIRIAIATFAYEVLDRPVMSDAEWDQLAQSIDPAVGTGHFELDEFFVARFSPMTGMWIHDHPELDKVRSLYFVHYGPRSR